MKLHHQWIKTACYVLIAGCLWFIYMADDLLLDSESTSRPKTWVYLTKGTYLPIQYHTARQFTPVIERRCRIDVNQHVREIARGRYLKNVACRSVHIRRTITLAGFLILICPIYFGIDETIGTHSFSIITAGFALLSGIFFFLRNSTLALFFPLVGIEFGRIIPLCLPIQTPSTGKRGTYLEEISGVQRGSCESEAIDSGGFHGSPSYPPDHFRICFVQGTAKQTGTGRRTIPVTASCLLQFQPGHTLYCVF